MSDRWRSPGSDDQGAVQATADAGHRGPISQLAEQAVRERRVISDIWKLAAAELEERERNTIARRIREAHLPRMKTLEEFDYAQSQGLGPRCRNWPEAGNRNAPNPSCSSGNAGPVKLIF